MTNTEIALTVTAVAVTAAAAYTTYKWLDTRNNFIEFAKANPTATAKKELIPSAA